MCDSHRRTTGAYLPQPSLPATSPASRSNKRKNIAQRARLGRKILFTSPALLVGAYFGSRMKSKSSTPRSATMRITRPLSSRRSPFSSPIRRPSPLLAVAPPEPQGVPSPAAGPPPARALPLSLLLLRGEVDPLPARHPPQESRASTSTAH